MDQRTRVVPVVLDDGTQIMARASVLGGNEDVAALEHVLSFNQVTATVRNIAKALNTTITELEPDKARIEFGIELALQSGQLSALLVQGRTAGNLKISLEWEKQKPKPPEKK